MLIDISYPAVAFAKGGIVHFARNADDLVLCSKRGWKSGFYDSLNIVDSEGKGFNVQEARKVGNVGLLWGFDFALGQRIKVELVHSEASMVSIEELKEKLLKQLKKDRHFWNSGGNLEEITSTVRAAKSHNEVLKYLAEIFFKKA